MHRLFVVSIIQVTFQICEVGIVRTSVCRKCSFENNVLVGLDKTSIGSMIRSILMVFSPALKNVLVDLDKNMDKINENVVFTSS